MAKNETQAPAPEQTDIPAPEQTDIPAPEQTDIPAPVLTEAQKEKAAKFVELANSRVRKTLESFKVIGNLASSNYIYTVEQTDRIIAALQSEIDALKAKFAKPEAAAKTGFTL